mmetsp:Transcript_9691/g.27937  ORF Transcript_9691/g.27937 Transcript_9691/m.27937 type:complete len:292 (-) Transcript_9691:630-1505(-)
MPSSLAPVCPSTQGPASTSYAAQHMYINNCGLRHRIPLLPSLSSSAVICAIASALICAAAVVEVGLQLGDALARPSTHREVPFAHGQVATMARVLQIGFLRGPAADPPALVRHIECVPLTIALLQSAWVPQCERHGVLEDQVSLLGLVEGAPHVAVAVVHAVRQHPPALESLVLAAGGRVGGGAHLVSDLAQLHHDAIDVFGRRHKGAHRQTYNTTRVLGPRMGDEYTRFEPEKQQQHLARYAHLLRDLRERLVVPLTQPLPVGRRQALEVPLLERHEAVERIGDLLACHW